MSNYEKHGFTLVEIMVVVAVIGILAAMAIVAFTKIREQSQDKVVYNNLRQIATAAQTYMLEHGSYSVTITDLYPVYMREPENVAGETYPVSLSLPDTQLEATGVGGSRTVVYQF